MRIRTAIVTTAVALGATAAGSAQAADVKLVLNWDDSDVAGSIRMPDGQYAIQAPQSFLRFEAGAGNDAGYAVLQPDGRSVGATIDLSARTVDGETVVDRRTIDDNGVIRFARQPLQQNTTYVARLYPTAAGGVAATTDSNPVPVRAYLKNHPDNYYSRLLGRLRIHGFYSRSDIPGGVGSAVRVLIQRKSGSTWRTIRTVRPDATRSWVGAINTTGVRRAVYRARTVPVGPRRYIALTDYRFCIAPTVAEQRRLCAGVGWAPRP